MARSVCPASPSCQSQSPDRPKPNVRRSAPNVVKATVVATAADVEEIVVDAVAIVAVVAVDNTLPDS